MTVRGRGLSAGAVGRWLLPGGFVLIWSSGYLVGSIGTRQGSPPALLAWRFLLAAVLLGGFAVATRAPWPRRAAEWGHLLVIGTLLQTVQVGGIFLGLAHGVSAGMSSFMLSVAPLLVSAAAVPLFGEQLSGRQWAGLLIGLAGVAASLSTGLSGEDQVAGYVFTGVALIALAVGTLYQKKVGVRVDLRTGTTIQLIGAALTSFPLAALHGGLGIPLTPAGAGSLAWLAVVNSIGSFLLLFVLLQRRSGGAATSLLYLVPPVTAVLGVWILGEHAGPEVYLGMTVSAIGVALVLTRKNRVAVLERG